MVGSGGLGAIDGIFMRPMSGSEFVWVSPGTHVSCHRFFFLLLEMVIADYNIAIMTV